MVPHLADLLLLFLTCRSVSAWSPAHQRLIQLIIWEHLSIKLWDPTLQEAQCGLFSPGKTHRHKHFFSSIFLRAEKLCIFLTLWLFRGPHGFSCSATLRPRCHEIKSKIQWIGVMSDESIHTPKGIFLLLSVSRAPESFPPPVGDLFCSATFWLKCHIWCF